jgi:hypothetical protein
VREIETEMVKDRKMQEVARYIEDRIKYQHRWEIYKKKHEEMVARKKLIIERLARKCGI